MTTVLHVLMLFQIVWEVILPAPSEVWQMDTNGVQLRHVKTGKLLAVTKKKYSEGDWGDGMGEVAGAKSHIGSNKWKVGFTRVPEFSK